MLIARWCDLLALHGIIKAAIFEIRLEPLTDFEVIDVAYTDVPFVK